MVRIPISHFAKANSKHLYSKFVKGGKTKNCHYGRQFFADKSKDVLKGHQINIKYQLCDIRKKLVMVVQYRYTEPNSTSKAVADILSYHFLIAWVKKTTEASKAFINRR